MTSLRDGPASKVLPLVLGVDPEHDLKNVLE
jgi:cytochrome oxidase Cu insertion factor (SCO1/SenC/PrrC family)